MEQDLNSNYISQGQEFINSSSFIDADVKVSKLKALEKFKQLGFPTKKNDDWKYTNLLPLFSPTFAIGLKKENLSKDFLENLNLENSLKAIFVNGQLDEELSSNELSFVPQENLKDNLISDDALEYLNYAYFEKAYSIEFSDKTVIKNPIEFIHVTTENAFGSILSPRIKVKVGNNSELTFLETHLHQGPDSQKKILTNGLTEFEIGNNSNVEHVQSQLQGPSAIHFHKLKASVQRDSSFSSFSFYLGAKTSRNNIHVDLNEQGAKAEVHGLFALTGEQHSDSFTIINHHSAHTESSQLFKGIMDEKSHGIFTGKIFVEKDSQQINSNQLSKNLLLSKKAQIHTRPILEIYADDVKCAHGATIGQLSEDEVFYLQSRGLPKATAQKLLCKAFGVEALDKIKSNSVKNHLMDILIKKLSEYNIGHFDQD